MPLVNNCVVMSQSINWSKRPTTRLVFDSEVAGGINGSEDRLALKSRPKRSVTFKATTYDSVASARMEARIKAALALGRCLAPIWPRQQYVNGTITGAFSGSYVTSVPVDGKWTWAVGDYAFLCGDSIYGDQIDALINCGGSGAGDWSADMCVSGAGSAVTTVSSIDVTAYATSKWAVPVPAIIQSARNYSSTVAGTMTYTLRELARGTPGRLRLHFAEIESGFDRTTSMRLQDITVLGATTQIQSAHEPFAAGGYAANAATFLDFVVTPDVQGSVTVQISSVYRPVKGISLTNVAAPGSLTTLDGRTLQTGDEYALLGQTLAKDNGVFIHGSYPTRATWADTYQKLNGLVFYVVDPALHSGQWYRCTNAGVWALGTAAVNFVQKSTGVFYASSITGIEFYQHAWDVAQVTNVSTPGVLKFAGGLKGVYDNKVIVPMVAGSLNASKLESTTNTVMDVDMTISEPLGADTGVTALTSGAEVCDGQGWDELLVLDPPMTTGNYPGTVQSTICRYFWEMGFQDALDMNIPDARLQFLKEAAIYDFVLNGGDRSKIKSIIYTASETGRAGISLNNKWDSGDFEFHYNDDDGGYALGDYSLYSRTTSNKLEANILFIP